MTLMNKKKYLLELKKNLKYSMYVTYDSFIFLDSLLDYLKRHRTSSDTNTLNVYDYRDDSLFSVNKIESQTIIDNFYQEYYYSFFFHRSKWCQKLLEKLQFIFNRSFNFDQALLYSKIILSSISFCIMPNTFMISRTKLHLVLAKNLEIIANQYNTKFSDDLITELIKLGLFQVFGEDFKISDESLILDLSFISLNSVKINDRSDNSVKYSCYYNLSTLESLIKKFTIPRNRLYFDLLNEYNLDIPLDQKKKIQDFFEDYYDLDLSQFNNLNNISYDLLKIIYIDKLVLNDYFFHSIIISCFDNYFYCSNRKNILYDKSGDLIFRLSLQ